MPKIIACNENITELCSIAMIFHFIFFTDSAKAPERESYLCVDCPQGFESADLLYLHISGEHPGELTSIDSIVFALELPSFAMRCNLLNV